MNTKIENSNLCYICQTPKNLSSYTMTCGHTYCVQCFYRLIFIHHINEFQDISQSIMRIHCKCRENTGSIDMNLDQILDLIKQKIVLDNELKNEKTMCLYHPNQEKSFYCKTCLLNICEFCSKEPDHYGHEIYENEEYAIKFRKIFKGFPLIYNSVKEFVDRFDNIINCFRKQIQSDFFDTVKEFNDLIDILNILKLEYTKTIKDKLKKGILVLKIIKLFYCNYYIDFQNKDRITDINTLKYLNNITYEFENMSLKNNDKIIQIMKSIKENKEELIKCKDNIIDFSFAYKKFPRELIQVEKLAGHKSGINTIIQSKDGTIITGSQDNTIRFWEEINDKYENTKTISKFTGSVLSLCQLKDGRLLSSAKETNIVKVWENVKGKYINKQTMNEHKSCILCIIQLSDDRVCTSSKDKTIKIWEIDKKQNKCIQTLTEHSQAIYIIREIQNRRFVSGSDDKSIRVWDDTDGSFKCICVLSGHDNKVRALCKMKDGKFASGGEDNRIKVWKEDKDWYNCICSIEAHHHGITYMIALNEDTIVSASKDRSIRIWYDSSKGLVKGQVLKDLSHTVFVLIQLSDGRLGTGGSDNLIILWKNFAFAE